MTTPGHSGGHSPPAAGGDHSPSRCADTGVQNVLLLCLESVLSLTPYHITSTPCHPEKCLSTLGLVHLNQ